MSTDRPRQYHQIILRLSFYAMTFAASSAAIAATVNQPSRPLDLPQVDVKPNLIMALDDSGSMDFELLIPGNDGAAWWHYDTNTSNSCPIQTFIGCKGDGSTDSPSTGTLNFYSNGTQNTSWRKYAYLFPNGTASGGRILADGTVDHFAIPPIDPLGYFRSPDFNKAYFDPTKDYDPWLSKGSDTFPDSPPTAAKTDPKIGSLTLDITRDRASDTSVSPDSSSVPCSLLGVTNGASASGSLNISNQTDHTFHLFAGMTLPVGTCFFDNRTTTRGRTTTVNGWTQLTTATGDYTVAAGDRNDGVSTAIRYFPATFYVVRDTSVGATTVPASFGYSATPTVVTIPAINYQKADGTTTAVTQLLKYEIKSANFSSGAAYSNAIQNFANWFTYYRKRHEALRGGVGLAFDGTTRLRLGSYTINRLANVTMSDLAVPANRTAFYDTLYNFTVSGGTPNREAVAYMVDQFNRSDSAAPITDACQKNFGMLFTDGFSNASQAKIAGNPVGNQDLNQGALFTDGQSDTMADLTMYGYKNTLRSTGSNTLPTGLVVPDADCQSTPATSPNYAALDCRRDLHMDFYGITLGGRGVTFGNNLTQTNDPYNNIPSWPTGFTNRNPTAVDDLWHAALNARGKLFLATTPKDLADKFSQILNNISSKTGDAAAVSLSAGSASAGALAYQAVYKSSDWTGQLIARPVSTGTSTTGTDCNSSAVGSTCPQVWEAGSLIRYTGRTVITMRDDTRAGVAFSSGNLTSTQLTQLNYNTATSSSDGNAALRIAYIRGSKTQEAAGAVPKFRNRSSLLGDIVNSNPYYVGAPSASYAFSGYPTFKANNFSRAPYVYVAANDGMLHAFKATSDPSTGGGSESFAYIPTGAYGSASNGRYPLSATTDPNYTHQFINDGSPVVGDVYYGGSWRSLLVNSLRSGGQGIYALDVTNPATFSESNASSIAKWEFTDADDADLGYVYGQPTIARFRDGNFYVVFSSGYNNTEADGRASTNGKGSIFILKASGPTGSNGRWTQNTDYYKITVNAGTTSSPDGMGSPYVNDINNDDKVDYMYTGDQLGNMWRTTLTSSNPSDWVLASNTVSIFTAVDPVDLTTPQPITMQPVVGYNLLTPTNQSDVVVYFGTGSYMDTADATYSSSNRTQTFYAVVDNLGAAPTAITRTSLVEQKILREVGSGGAGCVSTTTTNATGCFRQTTQNAVVATDRGFYLDLYNTNNATISDSQAQSTGANKGERAVTPPRLRDGFVYFNTLIPSTGTSNCSPGGSGWLMVLDAKTGKLLTTPALDTNNDNQINSSDLSSAGMQFGSSLSSISFIQIDNGRVGLYVGLGDGTIGTPKGRSGLREGRISWREIVPNN